MSGEIGPGYLKVRPEIWPDLAGSPLERRLRELLLAFGMSEAQAEALLTRLREYH